MTLIQITDLINYICVKENSGQTFTPQQRNTVYPAVNIDLFNKYVGQAELYAKSNQVPFSEALFSFSMLQDFRRTETITITTGSFTLSGLASVFAYWIKMYCTLNASYRTIDLITDEELANRRTNIMTSRPIDEYPCATITNGIIKILPNNIASADFTYIKQPVDPVYDYYIDANFNEVYLAAGATHTLLTGETGSAGQTAGTLVTSLTVEVEWSNLHFTEFVNESLKKVGIYLKAQDIEQYAQMSGEGKK